MPQQTQPEQYDSELQREFDEYCKQFGITGNDFRKEIWTPFAYAYRAGFQNAMMSPHQPGDFHGY